MLWDPSLVYQIELLNSLDEVKEFRIVGVAVDDDPAEPSQPPQQRGRPELALTAVRALVLN